MLALARTITFTRGCIWTDEQRFSQGHSDDKRPSWIGINAAIVGNITIGDDVLIAPNNYVNIDIPSHSAVFGNPCIIKSRVCVTESYVNHIVE